MPPPSAPHGTFYLALHLGDRSDDMAEVAFVEENFALLL